MEKTQQLVVLTASVERVVEVTAKRPEETVVFITSVTPISTLKMV